MIMRLLLSILLFFAFAVSSLAQTETAVRLYREASADKSKLKQFLSQDFSSVDSTSMHDLGVMFYLDKDYVSAGACWEEALQKVTKHGTAYEKILNKLSAAYSETNDMGKIEWLMGVIEEHNQHELLKECNDYKCKLERAQYYMSHGDEANARKHITESLQLCVTEEQRIEVEEAYAQILFDIHDFESCAQYYHSAAERWKKLGTDAVHLGTDMYWAAQNYMLAGQYRTAEECSRDAMNCFKAQSNDTDRKFYLMSLLSLGDALFCQQRYEESVEYYRQEMEGYAVWMPNSEKHADALEDMAKVETRLKKYDEAKVHYQEAIRIYKDLEIDDKYSNTYSSLMVCLRKAGDNDGADAMEREADDRRKAVYRRLLDSELISLETTRKYLGSLVYTNSLHTIAGCYFGVDRYAESALYYGLYSDNLRAMLRERFVLMSENDRRRLWKEQQQNIDEFLFDVAALPDSVSNMMHNFIPSLYDLELLSKGIMLNSSIEFGKVLYSMKDESLIRIYERIKANQEQIDELQGVASEENLQRVIALKQENTPLTQQLMNGCKDIRDYTEYISYTWKDVQSELGSEDVAIEFTTVSLSPLDKDTYLLALILSDKGEPEMSVISTKAIIKNLETKDDLYDSSAYYPLFWGFMQEHLEGKKRIFFAPNNMLSNIAIEYLRDGDKPFFETHEVYRLSSTKEICRERAASACRQLVIFGDIDYNAEGTSSKRDAIAFGRLDFSKAEIDGISATARGKYKVQIYDRKKATKQTFLSLSEKCPAVLHISSHGAFLGDSRTDADDAMEKSLLALSGANVPGQSSDNDGLVRASDVADMNLRNCDLAVLSACKTGIGGLGEDGVFGLQRGFKNAGVHSLLMSLKSVYDESTARLMISFYEGLTAGLSKREALLKAQTKLKSEDKFSEGKYWAPFILLDGLD